MADDLGTTTSMTSSSDDGASAVELATELTVAWLGNQNNRASADDVPAFLRTMHATLSELADSGASTNAESSGSEAAGDYTPAVTARKSLSSPDHIISMIDGKPYRTLRRHLTTNGLTPEQYRERYNLKADYPMVAPSYSEARRDMAKKIGLGSKGRAARKDAAATEETKAAPQKRTRQKASGKE